MFALLAHESCEVTGGLFDSSAGTVNARLFGMTPGFTSRDLTIEDVRDHLDEILDPATVEIVTDPRDAGQTGIAEVAKILVARPYEPLR